MFETYELFAAREIENILPEVIYFYLFDGLSLTEIENRIFRTEEYSGWMSKALLNLYGIETHGENKGIFQKRNISEVVGMLQDSPNIYHVRVGKILKDKFL